MLTNHSQSSHPYRQAVVRWLIPIVALVLMPMTVTPVAGAQGASATPSLKPVVTSAARHDTSPALRKIAQRLAQQRSAPERDSKGKPTELGQSNLRLPKAEAGSASTDNRRETTRTQAAPVQNAMPDFISDFEGTSNVDDVYPPDTNGDVGGDFYVQMVNLSFQIFDKTSGDSLVGPLPGNALWEGFGGDCETHNDGDPVVLYDELAGRWMMSQFALFGDEGNAECIAISETGDPTGAWHRYSFLISDSFINDYPHFGVWPDAYYMSINQFDQDSFEWAGAGAIAFERDQMLQGQPARMVAFNLFDVNELFGGQLPSDLDGVAPQEGAPNVFLEADDDAFGFEDDQISGWEFHVDWAAPENSTFGLNGEPNFALPVDDFDAELCGFSRSCIPQPDTSTGLDTISDRLMFRVQYRNFGDHQSLVTNHTVDVDDDDHAGVRWYELRSTGGADWNVHQQGTFAPDEDNRWMGSAAMDISGNIAVGYSVASETTYPSIRVAGRLANDPLGELAQGETELIAGTGSQTGEGSRWGDYSSMSVDPADQCTFYFTTEYVAETGEVPWQTRIGSMKFPNCSAGPSGTVQGIVTDSVTGNPLEDANVKVGSSSTTTAADGTYSLRMPVGTYDVAASKFAYSSQTSTAVEVAEEATVTRDFALVPQPLVTVRGRVLDGSGHGWPLYAKVSVQGVPVADVYTRPTDGTYRLRLPASATYTFEVTSMSDGYEVLTEDVAVGAATTTHTFRMLVDASSCVAPGYAVNSSGTTEGFDDGATPAGWSVEDNLGNGEVWTFDDPGERGNATGGDGGFAVVDSDNYGEEGTQDTSLVSPSFDLSAIEAPVIQFAQEYDSLGDVADVDLSLDGGTTWETVLHQTSDRPGPDTRTVELPSAANQTDVRVRFHYYDAAYAWWWMVDDVFVGNRTCDPVPGGLVWGYTSDSLTGDALNGTKVAAVAVPEDAGVSAGTPEDDTKPDGFYSLFSSRTGKQQFTATNGKFRPLTRSVRVIPNQATRLNFALLAGKVTVEPTELEESVELGGSTSSSTTYTNVGNAPAQVTLGESNGDFTILRPDGTKLTLDELMGMRGAPHKEVRGTFLPGFNTKGTSPAVRRKYRTLAADPWTSIADFPTPTMDNAVANGDGLVYSVGGVDGGDMTSAGFVYDPATLSWTGIADLPEPLEQPNAAFIDGKLIVAGGWDVNGAGSTATYLYDPSTDSWTTGAELPVGVAAAGVTTSNGLVYLIGGCQDSCGFSDVQVYDAAADSWGSVADYPEPTSWVGCGDVSGAIYCAGGTADDSSSAHTYAYDTSSDSWTAAADMPVDVWGMGYTAANGLLLVSGGVQDNFETITNEGYAYDPGSDSWTSIPNSDAALYRGGSACGFYRIGGSVGGFEPVAAASVLPGFDACGVGGDVTWLSETPTEFTLAPGQSAAVAVGLDASGVAQPGTYTARITAATDTPYRVTPVEVTMNVTPPANWGKLTGVVEGRSCANVIAALPGATVQIDGTGYSQTLITDSAGAYGVWFPAEIEGLRQIAAKDGYVPQTRTTDVLPGRVTTEDYLLRKTPCR